MMLAMPGGHVATVQDTTGLSPLHSASQATARIVVLWPPIQKKSLPVQEPVGKSKEKRQTIN